MRGWTASFRGAVVPAMLAWLAVALAAGPSSAQSLDQYIGRPIGQVRIAVSGVVKVEPDLFAVVDTKPGRPLDMTEVREAIVHLMALARFDGVTVIATSAGANVDLLYDCTPRRVVSGLVFRGDLGLPEKTVRDAVTQRFGQTPPAGRADDIATSLETFYNERGYTRATVKPEVAPERESTRTDLVLVVNAGPRARYGAISVEGDVGVPPAQIVASLQIKSGDPYDRVALQERLGKYVDALHARGFYEARLGLVSIPSVSADGTTATIVLAGERGPHVTVEFRGGPLPKGKGEELVPIKREGSVDEDLLEDSGLNIQRYLQSQGYRNAKTSHEREQHDGELKIIFTIERGPLYRIHSVSLPPGIPAVGLQEGTPFLQFRLDTYIAAVLQQYREKGFESARAEEPTIVPLSESLTRAEVQVDIRVKVSQGPQTLMDTVAFAGNHAFTTQKLNEAIRSRPGGPFYGPLVASDADSIRVLYLNAGYQDADVRPVESFKDGRSRVDVRFEIREGQRIYVDRILVVGNDRTSTKTIEGEILLKPGEPLSSEALVESQRRLSGLGLFRRVQVTPQARGVGDRRDVLITVLEAPATTIGYGGGLEGGKRLRGAVGANGQAIESIDIAPHGSFEIGRRNLWGKNRSINLFTRASLRASDIQQNPNGTTSGGGYGFHEYRVLGSYREPRAFGSQSDVVFTAFVEQAVRSSFDFNRREARAEIVHRLAPRISISGQYSIERTRLFNERIAPADQLDIDRIFAPGVTLSAFSSSIVRDTRDDQLNPTSGSLLLFNGEVAARAIGSEVGLAKTFGQAFWFHRLPGPRGVVFATGARLGLATGFPRPDPLGTGTVREVPASERFFAGGDTTVRGFALDRLGTPNTLDANGVPKGGNALLIFNAEIRVPLGYRFDGVAFLDLGNVFATVSDLSVADLRSGAGFGLRYRSPIGPIRLDIGFKLDRHRFADGTRESPYQWYIGIGQAF